MTRISDLPTRNWREGCEDLIAEANETLRTPRGTMSLRAIQAVSLVEAYEQRGLFCNARVGGGKTLISALLPTILEAKRPLLLMPANLIKSKEREFTDLRLHWQIPRFYPMMSYTQLGRNPGERADGTPKPNPLELKRPDLIVCDEAHKLKHVTVSAVGRRVARYMAENPNTMFCALSGSLSETSILDYAHMLIWALGKGAPVPYEPDIQAMWGACLDENVRERPTDFSCLVPDLGKAATFGVQDAREAYRKRLNATPGVVISGDTYDAQPLTIAPRILETPLEDEFRDLRTLWITPDGWPLADNKIEVYGVARRLALGFDYYYDPRPPEHWFYARKEWCATMRRLLAQSTTYDSAGQVELACAAGLLSLPTWDKWQAVKDDYDPKAHRKVRWFSDHVIDAVIGETQGRPSIVWVEHDAFARRLAERTGWAYFKNKGRCTRTGKYIEDARGTVIASVDSNKEGRNLQYKWKRNVLVSPRPGAGEWEQLLARTHRDGQKHAVECVYFVGCYENAQAIATAKARATALEEREGQAQKILFADLIDPSGYDRTSFAFKATAA